MMTIVVDHNDEWLDVWLTIDHEYLDKPLCVPSVN